MAEVVREVIISVKHERLRQTIRQLMLRAWSQGNRWEPGSEPLDYEWPPMIDAVLDEITAKDNVTADDYGVVYKAICKHSDGVM